MLTTSSKMHCCKAASVWYRRRDRMHSCCAIKAVSRDFASLSTYRRRPARVPVRGIVRWQGCYRIMTARATATGEGCGRALLAENAGARVVMRCSERNTLYDLLRALHLCPSSPSSTSHHQYPNLLLSVSAPCERACTSSTILRTGLLARRDCSCRLRYR
jgi:hypothetical protein